MKIEKETDGNLSLTRYRGKNEHMPDGSILRHKEKRSSWKLSECVQKLILKEPESGMSNFLQIFFWKVRLCYMALSNL